MDFWAFFPRFFLVDMCFDTCLIGFHYLHMYLYNWILYLDFTSHILCIFSVVYALHVTVSVENDSVCCAYENQLAVGRGRTSASMVRIDRTYIMLIV